MNIIAIDPGLNGAICVLKNGIIIQHSVCPIIKTDTKRQYDIREMINLLSEYQFEITKVYIEKVNSMPREGVTSAFRFGYGFGIWVGICSTFRYPIEFVPPQKWKKVMITGSDKSKGASILKAKQIYPSINLRPTERCTTDDDGLAEAFLIAKYGEKMELGS